MVVASKGGSDAPPAWYLNLRSTPEASVLTAGHRIPVRARVLEGDERRSIVPSLVEYNANWRAYFANVERSIPVILLERR